jgi:hypothetical protein
MFITVLWLELILLLVIFYWYLLRIRHSFLMIIFLSTFLLYNIVPPLIIPLGLIKINFIPASVVNYSLILSLLSLIFIFIGFFLSTYAPIFSVNNKLKLKLFSLNSKMLIYLFILIDYLIYIYLVITGHATGIIGHLDATKAVPATVLYLSLLSGWSGPLSLLLLNYDIENGLKKYDAYIFIFVNAVFYLFVSFTRYPLIILIIGSVYLLYLKNVYRISKLFFRLFITFIVTTFVLFFYGYFRSFGLQHFSYNQMLLVLKPNHFIYSLDFPIVYEYFLRTIQSLGKTLPYVYGLSLYKVFLIFLPRSVFPSKPLDPSIIMMKHLSPHLYNLGISAGNGFVGESYMNFGLLGIILFGLIFGFLIGYIEKLFSKNVDCIWEILYIYLIGLSIQLNRGISSALVAFVINSLIPIVVFKVVFSGDLMLRRRSSIYSPLKHWTSRKGRRKAIK